MEDWLKYALWSIIGVLIIAAGFAGRSSGRRQTAPTLTAESLCSVCITINQNGELFNTSVGTITSISLPRIIYEEESLVIEPASALQEVTIGEQSDSIHWQWLYIVRAPGTVRVSAASRRHENPPFRATIIAK